MKKQKNTAYINRNKLIISFVKESLKEYSVNIKESYIYPSLQHSITLQEKYLYRVLNRVKSVNSLSKMGDFHNGQKCTLKLLSLDQPVMYKPTWPSTPHLLNKILKTCSTNFAFKEITILQEWRDAYTCKYIPESSQQKVDISTYSYHFGALTLLAYVFRMSDLHDENIICNESVPVIVDPETLLYPEIEGLQPFSFHSSLLIPGPFNHEPPMKRFGLVMKNEFNAGVLQLAENLTINSHSITELLHHFNKLKTRVILKPTNYYQKILINSLHPSIIDDHTKRVHYLKQCLQGAHPITKLILDYELNSLINLDIPYFYHKLGKIYDGNGKVIPLNVQPFDKTNCLKQIAEKANQLLTFMLEINNTYSVFSGS